MRIVKWSEDLALGIEHIDADHAKLLLIVQEIDAMLTAPSAARDFHDRIVRLFRFADEHFSREDTLMDRLPVDKYGEHIEAHRQMHVAFLSRIAGISNRSSTGDDFREPAASAKALLTELVVEMVATDRLMVDHLIAEGVI